MTSTKIELSNARIRQVVDPGDLAELLFPGNRNQQHAFLVVWTTLKWRHDIVPNLTDAAREQDVTRRTLERVRAKLRRLGVIEHVSRFSSKHGYREGWMLSARLERNLRLLADKIAMMRETGFSTPEKDDFALKLAAARRDAASGRPDESAVCSCAGDEP